MQSPQGRQRFGWVRAVFCDPTRRRRRALPQPELLESRLLLSASGVSDSDPAQSDPVLADNALPAVHENPIRATLAELVRNLGHVGAHAADLDGDLDVDLQDVAFAQQSQPASADSAPRIIRSELVSHPTAASGVQVLLYFDRELDASAIDTAGVELQHLESGDLVPLDSVTYPGGRRLQIIPAEAPAAGRYRVHLAPAIIVGNNSVRPQQPLTADVQNQVASVRWIAANGDWNNPDNWSSGRVPTAADDVVINVPGAALVRISGTEHAVRNLLIRDSLRIQGGSLSVSGTAQLDALQMDGGRLEVAGQQSSLVATGPTSLRAADLIAADGGRLELPRLTSYLGGGQVSLLASGSGSRLDLSAVTQVTNGRSKNSTLTIAATDGGVIDLSRVTDIQDEDAGATQGRRIIITATGSDSRVDLTSLHRFRDADPQDRSVLQFSDGGSVFAPVLQQLGGISLSVSDQPQRLGASTLQSVTDSEILIQQADVTFAVLTDATGTAWDVRGVHVDAPRLEDISLGSVSLNEGGTIDLQQVSRIDGASFLVTDGVTLSLPSVTTYAATAETADSRFEVSGLLSVLDLSGLTNITDLNSGRRLEILATDGGRIDLSSLTQQSSPEETAVTPLHLQIIAEAAGSVVDLSSLTALVDVAAGESSVTVRNGAAVLIPQVTRVDSVSLTRAGNGQLPVSQVQQIIESTVHVLGDDINWAALTSATGTHWQLDGSQMTAGLLTDISYGSVSLTNGGTIDLPQVSRIDGSSLFVSGGVTLSLPAAVSYADSEDDEFVADGPGSVLDLSRLESITNGSSAGDDLFVTANNGGQIDLRGVTDILDLASGGLQNRSVVVVADGPASLVDLSALRVFFDASGDERSQLAAVNSGIIRTESETGPVLVNVEVIVGPDSTVDGSLQLGEGSSLDQQGTITGRVTGGGGSGGTTVTPGGNDNTDFDTDFGAFEPEPGDISFRVDDVSVEVDPTAAELLQTSIDVFLDIEQLETIPAIGWGVSLVITPASGATGSVTFDIPALTDTEPNLLPASRNAFTQFDVGFAGRSYGAVGPDGSQLNIVSAFIPPAGLQSPPTDAAGNLSLPDGAGLVSVPLLVSADAVGEFYVHVSGYGDRAGILYAVDEAGVIAKHPHFAAFAAASGTLTIGPPRSPAGTLDVDQDGAASLFTDGLLIARYLAGFTGSALVADAVSATSGQTDPTAVSEFLAGAADLLDADGDGSLNLFTDGILIARYLAGFRGDSLVSSVLNPNADLTTATEIAAHLDTLLPEAAAATAVQPAATPANLSAAPAELFADTDLDLPTLLPPYESPGQSPPQPSGAQLNWHSAIGSSAALVAPHASDSRPVPVDTDLQILDSCFADPEVLSGQIVC